MGKYYGYTINKEAACAWPTIQAEAAKYPRFTVSVERYDEEREISKEQMAYMHAVLFPAVSEFMGVSLLTAELTCKVLCGKQWLVKEVGGEKYILSKTSLTTKQTTLWLENCWDFFEEQGCPVPPPDKEWATRKE